MKLKKSFLLFVALAAILTVSQLHAERIVLHQQKNDMGAKIEPYFEVRHNSPASLWLLYRYMDQLVQVPVKDLPKGLTLDEKTKLIIYGNGNDLVACGAFDEEGNVTPLDPETFGIHNESSCKLGVESIQSTDGTKYSQIYLDVNILIE